MFACVVVNGSSTKWYYFTSGIFKFKWYNFIPKMKRHVSQIGAHYCRKHKWQYHFISEITEFWIRGINLPYRPCICHVHLIWFWCTLFTLVYSHSNSPSSLSDGDLAGEHLVLLLFLLTGRLKIGYSVSPCPTSRGSI